MQMKNADIYIYLIKCCWWRFSHQVTSSSCDPLDCSAPGSSVHGILQARILQWVAVFSSRGSSRPRDQTCVSCISCIGRQILYHCTTWEAPVHGYMIQSYNTLLSCLLASSMPLMPILLIHCPHNNQSASFKTWGHIM